MTSRYISSLVAGFIILVSWPVAGGDEPSSPKLTVSKETTYFTGPLTKDGLIDYAAAVNQRMSAGVTAENNAVVQFYLAHGPAPGGTMMPERFFKLLGMPMPPTEGDYFLDLGEHLEKMGVLRQDPLLGRVLGNQEDAATGPWTREDFPHIALWLDMNSIPLSLIVEGTRRTHHYSPLIVGTEQEPHSGALVAVLLPSVQLARTFARALIARAMLNLGEGNIEAAWQDLMSCQRLGRVVAKGPTLIEGLVGIVICGMASETSLTFLEHSDAGADQFAHYRRDLEQLVAMPSMADKVDLAERCMLLDCMLLLASESGAADVLGDEAVYQDLKKLVEQPSDVDWDTAGRVANTWYDRCVAAMRIPEYRQRQDALKEFNLGVENLTRRFRDSVRVAQKLRDGKAKESVIGKTIGEHLVSLLLPAVEACQTASDRNIQIERNLRLACALAAYRSEKNEYPKRLQELVPEYIDSIPSDLFSDQPLRYRRQEEGYVLYSIGPNETDDQGRWHNDKPPGDDPCVRMPPTVNEK